MKKNSYWTIACIGLLFLGGLYYFVKEEPVAPQEPSQEVQSAPSARIAFDGSSIVEEKDGKRLWELSAENIEVDTKTKEVFLKNLKGVFYRDNGGRIDVTAETGSMDPNTKDITMSGSVKAVSSDGAVFTAPQTQWIAKDQRILGTGGVKLTRGDTVITGDQLNSDANLEKVRIQGNAHVVKGGSSE